MIFGQLAELYIDEMIRHRNNDEDATFENCRGKALEAYQAKLDVEMISLEGELGRDEENLAFDAKVEVALRMLISMGGPHGRGSVKELDSKALGVEYRLVFLFRYRMFPGGTAVMVD